MKAKIGIIGNGNVGSAIRRGLEKAGYEVRAVGKDPGGVRDAGVWAGVIVLAVPFGQVDAAVRELGGGADGKPLVDATNALGNDMQLALGFTTSGAEELQKKVPRAKVVKAFNTVFASTMDSGRVAGQQLTGFAAADDAEAKRQVLGLLRDVGFDAVDAGPLKNARWLEALGYLNIQLGYVVGMGANIGFRLVH
ncbi:MAG TPA: NAD(P)-binding domain-containing protein [Anaeromyxobacteraceae bacterium]|nr:NAD(P)-binding domain-containing protein [Anaeromyxobacteraceae bacterium]